MNFDHFLWLSLLHLSYALCGPAEKICWKNTSRLVQVSAEWRRKRRRRGGGKGWIHWLVVISLLSSRFMSTIPHPNHHSFLLNTNKTHNIICSRIQFCPNIQTGIIVFNCLCAATNFASGSLPSVGRVHHVGRVLHVTGFQTFTSYLTSCLTLLCLYRTSVSIQVFFRNTRQKH